MKKFLFILFTCFSLVTVVSAQKDSVVNTIRIMTYNIHHGEGIDSVIDISRISNLILKNKIDLAALQEVDRGVQRTNMVDIPGLLAQQTEMNYSFYKNINYQGGEYGNCILSRFPIIRDTNFQYKMLREGEQRGLLQTIVNIEGYLIAIMNTHLDYREDDSERISNIEEIFKTGESYSDMPIIITGDFNDTPECRAHLRMKEKFIDVWEELNGEEGFTYPTENPTKRIDYIFLKNLYDKLSPIEMIPQKIFILNSIASDHLPVIAEFVLVRR